MSIASLVFTIVGASIALLVAMATLVWWAYKRGVAAGLEKAGRAGDQARIAALERELKEIQHPKRRRI